MAKGFPPIQEVAEAAIEASDSCQPRAEAAIEASDSCQPRDCSVSEGSLDQAQHRAVVPISGIQLVVHANRHQAGCTQVSCFSAQPLSKRIMA